MQHGLPNVATCRYMYQRYCFSVFWGKRTEAKTIFDHLWPCCIYMIHDIMLQFTTLLHLHDIYVHKLDKSVFMAWALISADPHLNVIGSWQCRAEPRRVVELAAGTSRTTPLTIPQRIYETSRPAWSRIGSVTEVVVSNKWGILRWPVGFSACARTNKPCDRGVSNVSYKCPDVLL